MIDRSVNLKKLLLQSEKLNVSILTSKVKDENLKIAIYEKLRALWTYNSNAIEGSTLSLGDTIFFLKEGITVVGKPFKDFLDAKNHAEAIDFLYDVIQTKRPLSPGLMKEINALLLSGITETPAMNAQGQRIMKKATPGQYKKQPNHVLQSDGSLHRYVDPVQVESEMEKLFQWVENHIDSEHPIITASNAHYHMTRIHPFDDGNGRGSRILMNLILIKKFYPPAIIKTEKRKEYLEALKEADKNLLEPFIEFIAKSLISTQKMILEELQAR